jgi:hypothetical protein
MPNKSANAPSSKASPTAQNNVPLSSPGASKSFVSNKVATLLVSFLVSILILSGLFVYLAKNYPTIFIKVLPGISIPATPLPKPPSISIVDVSVPSQNTRLGIRAATEKDKARYPEADYFLIGDLREVHQDRIVIKAKDTSSLVVKIADSGEIFINCGGVDCIASDFYDLEKVNHNQASFGLTTDPLSKSFVLVYVNVLVFPE